MLIRLNMRISEYYTTNHTRHVTSVAVKAVNIILSGMYVLLTLTHVNIVKVLFHFRKRLMENVAFDKN